MLREQAERLCDSRRWLVAVVSVAALVAAAGSPVGARIAGRRASRSPSDYVFTSSCYRSTGQIRWMSSGSCSKRSGCDRSSVGLADAECNDHCG